MSFIDKELMEEAESLSATLRKKRTWLNDDEKSYYDDYNDSKDYLTEGKVKDKYVAIKEKKRKEIKNKKRDAEKKLSNVVKDSGIREYINTRDKDVKTESMTQAQQYDYIIREHFDIIDFDTRNILVSVSEADKNQVLSSLTNKLYNNIVAKVDDIDFGTIPDSRGDITKIDNYDKLMECINLLDQIMDQYKQDRKNNIDVIMQAIGNVRERKELFEKAFAMNLELPIVLYSSTVLAIVSSVSFMISSCIEFIKSPGNDTFDIIVDKVALTKTKDNLLFVNLTKFNEACRKGQIDSAVNFVIKNRVKNFTGVEISLIIGVAAIMGVLLNIVPIMRELIFFFFYARVKIADYYEIQADLLQMNAYNLEHSSTTDKDDIQKIVKKQLKVVDRFRKISNVINIDNKTSEVKATKEITQSTKKYKYSDVSDTLPDSVSSNIF